MKKTLMPLVSLAALMAFAPMAVMGSPQMDIAGENVEALLKEVKQELERVGSDTRKVAEDALKQVQKSGQMTEEAKNDADKALKQFHELSGAMQKLEGTLEGLEGRHKDLEQEVAGGGRPGGGTSQTAGQEIAESDQLKNWLQNGMGGNFTMKPANAITSADGEAGGLIWSNDERAPVNMPRQRLPIRDLLMVATTDTDVVRYSRQVVRAGAAAPTAEGAPSPESVFGYEKAETNVRKITSHANASDEALADSGQLQGLIDGELRYDTFLAEERQILSGDGTGENLNGLITEAGSFVAAAGLPDETRIDRLRLGLLQVALANYAANGITIHPVDWAAIDLQKDTQGRYIFGNPNGQSTPSLWGLDVVPTLSHAVGEWMCGNFFMAATLYDRQDTEILISSEHGNNFIEGLKTIKATKRLALANKRPAALVTGDFTFS